MIGQISSNSVCTATSTFHVESTLRGGHIVRIRSIDEEWTGLYRCGDRLVLLARCQGTPPSSVAVSREVHAALNAIIRALCAP